MSARRVRSLAEIEAMLIESGVPDLRPALIPEPPSAWERLCGVAPVMLGVGLSGLLGVAYVAGEWAVTWQAAVDAARMCST